jgi:hypothetical protein
VEERTDDHEASGLVGFLAEVGFEDRGVESHVTNQDVEPSYVELADAALGCAGQERNDSRPNVAAHFERLCATRHMPFDQTTAQRAIDAAIDARDKAAREVFEQARAIRPRPPSPTPRRSRSKDDNGVF